MIPLLAMHSTLQDRDAASWLTRRGVVGALPLAGCGVVTLAAEPLAVPGRYQNGTFVMQDGTRLPYRRWRPAGPPTVVALALHGFNDSRDAWDLPATELCAAGFVIYAPDQRGFGGTATRGQWSSTAQMVADAADMARQVQALHPAAQLVLLGESMGGAVLMCLATSGQAPAGARYVLSAPAVWGRITMNAAMRLGLWLTSALLPGLAVSRAPVRVVASDNREALVRLSRDPLTLHTTRFGTLRGLVDLMDAALSAAPAFTAPGLFLYGGRDELVPPGAMARMWRRLPNGDTVRAYYPQAYHLLLRDMHRAAPLQDIATWAQAADAPLPSGADRAAESWLARQP